MNSRPLLSRPWVWHSICCGLALIASVPILWPHIFLPDELETVFISYAGGAIMASFIASLLLLAATAVILLLHMRYLRTLGQLLIWAGQWCIAGFLFGGMAYVANVPMPGEESAEAKPIQTSDRLYMADDLLTGPDALVIRIAPEHFEADTIHDTPHLTRLDQQHGELLSSYLETSPRWSSYLGDDTFYTKLGHVVMVPTFNGSVPGLVHVAFRRMAQGEQLPTGYTRVKPGMAMPSTPEGSEQVADLALDLGRSHYLLLAWRGTSHAETAHRALNAAIATVDAMLQPLADAPTAATLRQLLEGKRNISSSTPEILLSQPPAQYGTYQTEIHVNPGEPGTLILRIADLDTNTTLRLFRCPALYSANPAETFRHDIPGALPAQTRASSFGYVPGLLPENASIFAIRHGVSHQFFGVVFEVLFTPAAPTKPLRMLLRRCYRVQACEGLLPTHAETDPAEEEVTETPAPPPTEEPKQEEPAAEPVPVATETPAPQPTEEPKQEEPAAEPVPVATETPIAPPTEEPKQEEPAAEPVPVATETPVTQPADEPQTDQSTGELESTATETPIAPPSEETQPKQTTGEPEPTATETPVTQPTEEEESQANGSAE